MTNQFAMDVHEGLTSSPKFLPSKYFYDEYGDKLFQQIMELDEYYLTRKEFEVLESNKNELLKFCSDEGTNEFQLIEFGAGDGTKTKILLDYYLQNEACFEYIPVDISGSVLDQLMEDLNQRFPTLKGKPVQGDYFSALKKLDFDSGKRKIVLFLGSNIGNFLIDEAQSFIQQLADNLSPGDMVLIGFDLKKDPRVLVNAYDDSKGVTAEFNYNLLRRINRELGGDFDVENYTHVAKYDPLSGAMESFLVSKIDQSVSIGALNETYTFDAWEAIHTEVSQKFDLKTIEMLALNSNFKIVNHFMDPEKYFTDSLWVLNK